MIWIQMKGGLGNQLSQIAAGFCFAKTRNTEAVILDLSQISFGTDKTRRLEIQHLNLIPRSLDVRMVGSFFSVFRNLKPPKIGSSLSHLFSSTYRLLHAKSFQKVHDGNFWNTLGREIEVDNILLDGYFIDFSIVEFASGLGFKQELQLKDATSSWLATKLKTIDFYDSVALHVRLGDYLKFPKIFGTLSEGYYLDALDRLGVRADQSIFIFSDQPNRVANIIPVIASRKNTFIVRSPDIASFEILYLLAQFRTIICANSTFSMWAAWFSDGEGERAKRVVVPTPYLLDKPDPPVPHSWIKISR